MSAIVSTQRTARTSKTCAGCGETIPAGADYLEHKAPPHTRGLGNPDWWTKHECMACAGRLGRDNRAPSDFMVPLFDAEGIA